MPIQPHTWRRSRWLRQPAGVARCASAHRDRAARTAGGGADRADWGADDAVAAAEAMSWQMQPGYAAELPSHLR